MDFVTVAMDCSFPKVFVTHTKKMRRSRRLPNPSNHLSATQGANIHVFWLSTSYGSHAVKLSLFGKWNRHRHDVLLESLAPTGYSFRREPDRNRNSQVAVQQTRSPKDVWVIDFQGVKGSDSEGFVNTAGKQNEEHIGHTRV